MAKFWRLMTAVMGGITLFVGDSQAAIGIVLLAIFMAVEDLYEYLQDQKELSSHGQETDSKT